jgi:predicted membrane protein
MTPNPPYLARIAQRKDSLMNVSITQQQPPEVSARISVKLIVGIFFTLLGVLLTLDNLDLADADRILPWWPVFLIAIGLLKFQDRSSRTLAIFLIGAGALLIVFNNDWLQFSIFDFWPIALVFGGLGMIARAFGFRVSNLSDEPKPTIWAILGMRKEKITASNYAGGRIIAFMGGCELDLRKADIAAGSAELEIIVIWGGIEIKVPEGWEVIGNTVPIMGGADIRTKAAPGGRRLIVNGLAIMGGVDIKSVAVEAL